MQSGPSQAVAKKARKNAALLHDTALLHDDLDGMSEQKRLAMRKALPHSQRRLIEDDEFRLRKVRVFYAVFTDVVLLLYRFVLCLYRFMLFLYRFMLFLYRFMLFLYRFMLFLYRFMLFLC